MINVPIESIKIPSNRQRRVFDEDKLMRLQESIENLGLMHPIVVRNEGGELVLVAGERRLRVVKELWALGSSFEFNNQQVPDGCIPVATMGELDRIEAMDAELSENIVRESITWQERCEAMDKLNKLRKALNPDHTNADLAEEITGRRDGRYQDDIRQSLIVARHLDNPIVAKAKDVPEAYKLLKRAEELGNHALRAIEVGKTFSRSSHSALHGDCIQWMADLPSESFDCIVTDPPYGMGADEFGDAGGKMTAITHDYKDTSDDFHHLLTTAAPLFSRVAKPAAALYLCCDLDQFHWLRGLFNSSGWSCFRTPLINVKTGSGRVPLPDQGPRRQYELILFAFRGGEKTTSIQSDVIISRGDEQLGHGAQKPIALFADLIGRSCRPGDTVLDPFSGTGTIFPAAHGLKVIATGIEQNPAYFGMGVKRLEALE